LKAVVTGNVEMTLNGPKTIEGAERMAL